MANERHETRHSWMKQEIVVRKYGVSKLQAMMTELEDRERRNNIQIVGLAPNQDGGDILSPKTASKVDSLS